MDLFTSFVFRSLILPVGPYRNAVAVGGHRYAFRSFVQCSKGCASSAHLKGLVCAIVLSRSLDCVASVFKDAGCVRAEAARFAALSLYVLQYIASDIMHDY